MAQHNETGKTGESLGIGFCLQNGYSIIEKNWRHAPWEVDIIAVKNGILHFIEVKTRSTNRFGNPEDSVSNRKIRNLVNAAEQYLYRHPKWKRIQFDILSILMNGDTPIEFFMIEDVSL